LLNETNSKPIKSRLSITRSMVLTISMIVKP